MNLKVIEQRAQDVAKAAAYRGANAIVSRVARELGFGDSNLYADHPFNVAIKPLKAYAERHLTTIIMQKYRENAEAAALACLREDLKATERGDMTTKGLKP